MKDWVPVTGFVLTGLITVLTVWVVPTWTLPRRVKHHADLLTLLPDDLKEPLRSVLREELTEYAARERGRLHRSWRRLDGRRAALALAALLLSAFTAIAWGLDPSSAPLDYAFPASAPLIIAVALVRQGLWRPLPQDFDPKGPDGD